MNKRVIVLGILIVIIVASGIFGALYVLNNHDAATTENKDFSPDPAKQESQTEPDLSRDLGACESYPIKVKDVLGDRVDYVSEPDNRGIGHEPSGDTTQSCVYHLKQNETGDNRLILSVTEFSNDTNKQAALDAFNEQKSIKSELDDEQNIDGAYYVNANTGEDSTQHTYSVYVFFQNRLIQYQLDQPASSGTFDEQSAEQALLTIANSIEYSSAD